MVLSVAACAEWQRFNLQTKCHQCCAALQGTVPFIPPREMGKRPRTQQNKNRKGDAASEKLCWKDECGLWPFPSFLCWALWEFISALPAAVVAVPSLYLERARPKITVCSLYPPLGAAEPGSHGAGLLQDVSARLTSLQFLYLHLFVWNMCVKLLIVVWRVIQLLQRRSKSIMLSEEYLL